MGNLFYLIVGWFCWWIWFWLMVLFGWKDSFFICCCILCLISVLVMCWFSFYCASDFGVRLEIYRMCSLWRVFLMSLFIKWGLIFWYFDLFYWMKIFVLLLFWIDWRMLCFGVCLWCLELVKVWVSRMFMRVILLWWWR